MTAIDIIYDCIWIACNHINSTIYKQDISPDVSSVFVFHDPINFLVGEASKRLKLKTQPQQNGTLSTCSSYVPLLVYIRIYQGIEFSLDQCLCVHLSRTVYTRVVRFFVHKYPLSLDEAADGNTPLHLATHHRRSEVVSVLIHEGADVAATVCAIT